MMVLVTSSALANMGWLACWLYVTSSCSVTELSGCPLLNFIAAAPAVVGVCRAAPLAVIGRVNSTIASVNADVDVLLGKASREQLLPVYSEVKGLVCCMVPDMFASMWTGLTFAGANVKQCRAVDSNFFRLTVHCCRSIEVLGNVLSS
jgi:hypothetical protein